MGEEAYMVGGIGQSSVEVTILMLPGHLLWIPPNLVTDPNNIKIVTSLDAKVEEGSNDGLKKLKLVSLPRHKKIFKTEGIYADKFRLPYIRQVKQGPTSS